MINANLALQHYGISTTSVLSAVQSVRDIILEQPEVLRCAYATEILEKVIGVSVDFPATHSRSYIPAYITVQAVVEHLIGAGGMIEDADKVIVAAKKRADMFMENPANAWMFAKERAFADTTTEQQIIVGIEVQVAIKEDGSIKKGGKEILATALYEKYRADPAFDPNNENQPFIAILMKELSMSKAGATTYSYNCKKKWNAKNLTAKK